ncbi:unnamed protein product [Medioppia subpectinata]|uniref:Uncharacterized protein n=1 Tax=Medioppia subpectinata TaxID=1979941 RepID=A0A7R9LPW0_9ACAR|nr:unnamed protein product [Medioppia subpectinata]CAG2120673.1 unnamed protein product [Medioppia subpectinata]
MVQWFRFRSYLC